MNFRLLLLYLMSSQLPIAATANDAVRCKEVRLADIGWTDISATTAVAAELLRALEYVPVVSILSLQVAFTGLKNNDLDVFLGNWMPAQESDIKPYLRENALLQIQKNLERGRYTMAVPEYVYDAGVHDFADLNKFANSFSRKIYGIEPGNDGNNKVLKMIKQNSFGLGKWNLVESSEQGMLVEVKRAVAKKEFIVFLGWEPHPMNAAIKMRYLEGGDAFFGVNMGESTVHTLTRRDYPADCPNATQLFKQLIFNINMENQLMHYILDLNMTPQKAAQKWLGENVDTALGWIKNITTFSGQLSAQSFQQYVFTVNNTSDDHDLYKFPIGAFVEDFFGFFTDK
ncbi:MAG: choline ABC transporter substrate-binding protein, partial [bacterium]|nr:choline ABC transporter substrate-binding protein [bacterium]